MPARPILTGSGGMGRLTKRFDLCAVEYERAARDQGKPVPGDTEARVGEAAALC